MKQLFQNLQNGKVTLNEGPVPCPKDSELLIQTQLTLVSPGTEKMLSDFGKSNIIQKIKSQPDKVKQVLQKIKTDGLSTTLNAVKTKLAEPLPLGYCNVGIVKEIGANVSEFQIGDRVISNGSHSEYVCVSKNLCAKIPENVTFEDASVTVLAAIALQGIRLSKPEIGETYVVIGLGIIGLLACQILKANGCKVIAFDYVESRVTVAIKMGADAHIVNEEVSPSEIVNNLTNKIGADAVIICAATKSNSPIEEAPKMCRKRGRVILVGVSELNLTRSDFYEKEISFQVSCSYGPGRYDKNYEDKAMDYPIGFVRWTEQRNFQAILELISKNQISTESIINKRIKFKNAETDYDSVLADRNILGALFEYDPDPNIEIKTAKKITYQTNPTLKTSEVKVGIIGVGNFARSTLIPALKKANANIIGIASTSGTQAAIYAKKHQIPYCTTDFQNILADQNINTVFILTRHDQHGKLVIEALKAKKHVFVEKPLTLSSEDLITIRNLKSSNSELKLMVGFNRRFSPLTIACKELIAKDSSPISMNFLINAGELPQDFWLNDPITGGGRLTGEACHFIDLAKYLAGSKIINSTIQTMPSSNKYGTPETFTINLSFESGSIASINYFSNGHKSYPKEKIQIFTNGRIMEIDNFRELNLLGYKKAKNIKLKKLDKGHEKEIQEFLSNITDGKNDLISIDDLIETHELCLNLANLDQVLVQDARMVVN